MMSARTNSSGAGTPLNSTWIPDRLLSTTPLVTWRFNADVGPRLVPPIETISPGATGPGAKVAEFTTVVTNGAVTCETTRFTGTLTGVLPPVIVMVPV